MKQETNQEHLQSCKKSTIEHTFKSYGGPQFELTKAVILEPFVQTYNLNPKNWKTHLKHAQNSYRYQLYRLITDNPVQRYPLTYAINCRPSGVTSAPYTIACQNRRVCPWCFVRRLDTLRKEILKIPAKTRNCSKLLMWKRFERYLPGASLPFFSTREHGPHKRLNALLTSQFVFPFVTDNQSLTVNHVGFQVIPSDVDIELKLFGKGKQAIPKMPYVVLDNASEENVLLAIQSSCRFNWPNMLDKNNFSLFKELFYSYPKQRFIRTSKNYFIEEENTCGK
jgi:hypothetical protein